MNSKFGVNSKFGGLFLGIIGIFAYGVPSYAITTNPVPYLEYWVSETVPGSFGAANPEEFAMLGDGSVREIAHGLLLPAVQISEHEFALGDGSVRVTEPNQFELEVNAFFDTDPFITYAIAVNNLTASTLNFVFSLNSPISGGPYGTSSASFSGSSTDIRGDGVFVTKIFQDTEVGPGSVDLGVDLGLFNCLGSGNGPFASYNCGPFGPLSGTFAVGFYNTMSLSLAFPISPYDTFSVNGGVNIGSPIPEPSSLALITLGALGFIRRKRGREN